MKLASYVRLVLAAVLLFSSAVVIHGASATGSVVQVRALAVGITEGPDPIPQVMWSPVRRIDEVFPQAVQIYGDAGRPDVSAVQNGLVVVWDWRLDGDRDIATLRYNGENWEPESLVTNGRADELDPRAFADKGDSVHVVWWVPEAQGIAPMVRYSVGAGADWSVEQSVALDGRRPSVVVWKGVILVAYERDSSDSGQEVVVAARGTQGEFAPSWTWNVDRTHRLDVVLHIEGDSLWIDWKQSADRLAYSIWTGDSWSDPETIPWTDPSWAGERAARYSVRDLVLGLAR